MLPKSYIQAKEQLLLGDYKASEFYFSENNYMLELAYCKLFSGDLGWAKSIFASISNSDFRADWAKKMIQIIEGRVYDLPSYFQVRNFLEIDLNLLIKAHQPSFVEEIINSAELLYKINNESYKFIARVMLWNGFDKIALQYLLEAKSKFFSDPEMHLMLANCYVKNNEYNLARIALANCLSILPNYLPAKKLLNVLKD